MQKLSPTCREYSRDLESYADGELSQARRRDLENHLALCKSCDARLRKIEKNCAIAKSVLGSFPRIAPRPDFDLRVLAKVAARQQSPLLNFCDRLDAVFSRPLPKLLGSSFSGILFGLVLVAAFLPRVAAPNEATPKSAATPDFVAGTIPTRADSSFYAFGRIPNEAALLRQFAGEEKKRRSRRPSVKKEPLWNADISVSPHSSSRGSLC